MAHTVTFSKKASVTITDTSRLSLVLLDSSFNEIQRLSLGSTSTTVPSTWTHSRLIQTNGVVVLGFVITNTSDATWGPNVNGEHYGLTQSGGPLTFGSEPDSVWTFEISSVQPSDIIEFEVDDNYGGDFLAGDPNRMAFTQLTVQPKNVGSPASITPLMEKGAGGANAWTFTALQNAISQGPQGNGTQIPDFQTHNQHVGDMESVHISMIGSNRNNYRVKKIQVENKRSGTIQVETITSGWDADGSYTLTKPGSFWGVGLGRSAFVITLLEVEPIGGSSPSSNSCDNSFQSGNFWNLTKEYYSEDDNSTAGYYNNYSEFISGSKIDSTLKNYEYKNPFTFTPSYGSSVNIFFVNDTIEYSDGYSYLSPKLTNNISIDFNLNFNNRSNEESGEIIDYINLRSGFKDFPYQIKNQAQYSASENYKSLYSIKPYFVQEFQCDKIDVTNNYEGNTSISAVFSNKSYSMFTARNIIEIESMDANEKQAIEDYRNKNVLDIMPAYSVKRQMSLDTNKYSSTSSKQFNSVAGINVQKNQIDLIYKKIDDRKLIKLLSFFINKQGRESFKFTIKEPTEKTSNYICEGISHSYLFKGRHDLSVSIVEVIHELKIDN